MVSKTTDKLAEKIKRIIPSVDSVEELVTQMEVSFNRFGRTVRKHRIDLSSLIPWQFWPAVDAQLPSGGSIRGISALVPECYEKVSIYAWGSGQSQVRTTEKQRLEDQAAARREEEKKHAPSRIALLSLLEKRSCEFPEAYDLAMQYETHRPRTIYSRKLLTEFFSFYLAYAQNGEEITLEEIGKAVGISQSTASKIINVVGLKPLIRPRKSFSGCEKEVIQRSLETGLSNRDTGYYLNRSKLAIDSYLKRLSYGERAPLITFGRAAGRPITSSMASAVLEASDIGGTNAEISSAVSQLTEVVDYVVSRRAEIEPQLTNLLRTVFNTERINTPYLNCSLQSLLDNP